MIPYLIPFESVGEFYINDSIENYLDSYSFTVEDFSNENTPSLNYRIDNPEITLFIDKGIIDYIGCYEELLYKGRNLIGMTISEFMNHTNENYYGEIDELDFEDDNIPQFVYEFENIGLQVWEKGKDGKIVTVLVNSKKHYSE